MLRHREPYLSFYKLLGFLPHDIGLYQQAVTHRSASFTDKEGRKVNNERLEFLGDAVFTLVSADILYHAFPEKKEGFLSNSRSRIIQRETLNQIAVEMGLDKLVQSDVQILSHNNYIYGNAFEALIGAVYLDVGFKRCRRFIAERIFAPYIDLEKITQTEINFKSKLVEWGQRQHVHIGWKLESASVDENNNPLFTVCAIAGQVEGEAATGYSKKEAQQKASQLILRKLYQDKDFLRAILYTERNASITSADEADTGRESVTQDQKGLISHIEEQVNDGECR